MRQVLGPGALGRPRGTGWRGRWEGGSGWGIHITPWLIHVNVWQNPLQCCEVISLQLIKINGKKFKNLFIKTGKKKKKKKELSHLQFWLPLLLSPSYYLLKMNFLELFALISACWDWAKQNPVKVNSYSMSGYWLLLKKSFQEFPSIWCYHRVSLMVQMVKNLSAVQETHI